MNQNQTRRSELEKLIKEAKAKINTNIETKASDGKEAKAGASSRASGSRTRGAKTRARASSSDQSQTPSSDQSHTPATPTETQAGEETMPDVLVTEKNGSEGHLTASKTTYYKGESEKEGNMEDGSCAANEVAPQASPLPGEPAGENKRKKVVIEEGSESDDEEEEVVKSETATRQDGTDETAVNSSSTRQQPTVVGQGLLDKPPSAVASPTPTAKAKERLVSYVYKLVLYN